MSAVVSAEDRRFYYHPGFDPLSKVRAVKQNTLSHGVVSGGSTITQQLARIAYHDILPEKNRGRIITVFGAGGDRDKTKRPIMGRIAGDYSDIVIVTSDNPRTEQPETIIDDIMQGITRHASVLREVDRRTAIERAIKCAQRGDVVLIAGKGHEDYQITGKEKKHFSDREIVEALI